MSGEREPSEAQTGREPHQIVLEARRENLEAARDFVERVCREADVPEKAVGQLQLAVDEVCTNLVLYAYKEEGSGEIQLSVEPGEAEVVVTITDWGAPFHPDQAPAPDLSSDWQTRKVGGLGWHLVRQVTDHVEYSADPVGGNVLRLVKKIERSQGSTEE